MNNTQIFNISKMVNTLIKEHGTRNPFNICENLGITVFFHTLSENRGTYMKPYGIPIITISKNLDKRTAEFVCAHELGHYFCDSGLNKTFLETNTRMITDIFEDKADSFAGQLLWKDINQYLDNNQITEWEIADCLNIPVCNVNEKLLELGIY